MDGVSVLKRDGSVEPFVMAKLLRCISHGFQSSGEPCERDSATGRGLAEAVHAYLLKSRACTAVPSDHLAELVELVMTQTGYPAASLAIKQHQHMRERLRRWLKVAHRRPRDGRFVQRQWDKSLVVRNLREVHDLDTPAARMIAARVEQIVFNCGLKVLTVELVDELVRSELLAWGLLPGALAVKQTRKRLPEPRNRLEQPEPREQPGL